MRMLIHGANDPPKKTCVGLMGLCGQGVWQQLGLWVAPNWINFQCLSKLILGAGCET